MAATANKTTATMAEPLVFIDGLADQDQRCDAHVICAAMTRLSGAVPVMWGPSIIGFGRYHYRYDSGRTGEACRIGFSPRKGQTVLYLLDGYGHRAAELARLGKHKTGKSCLYIKRLSDIDQTVLDEIIASSLAFMAQKYPE